ncbi:unnamed protein product, partial [Mesorhabditis belari]|uniref:Major facilitator superfamily (MFS) profile domain-containing protein n=1 Tax=Mesorhabditis belari TaxID=2138241 RepID=A0AAF3FKG2_9BILA
MEEAKSLEVLPMPRKLSTLQHYHNLDADKVLNAYGKFGRYQMFTYFMLNSVTILFAMNMMVMPFIVEKPEFYCQLPDNLDKANYQSIDSCTLIDTANKSLKCTEIRGTRYDFNSTVHQSLASEFNLLCDDYELTEHASSIYLFGGMLAAPLITQLSDRIGRPGFGSTGFFHTAFVLCTESVSTPFRNLLPALPAIVWVIGYLLSGVFRLFIADWRWLYFITSIPGILTIPLFWFIPESLHWLTTKDNYKAVEKYIQKANRFNGVKVSLEECRTSNGERHENKEPINRPNRTVLDIFRHKGLLLQLFLNSIVFIVMNGTYWALSLFSTDLSEDKMTGFFLSGIVELPGGLLGTWLLIKFPRRAVAACGFTLQGLTMLAAIYIPGSKSVLMIFPLACKVFNTMIWAVTPLVASELAPTTVRNTFTGLVSFLGDVGSVLAPYIKRLEAWDRNAPALVMTLASFLAAGCVLLIPETKGKKMPTDIDEFDSGPLRRLFAKTAPENRKSETNPKPDQQRILSQNEGE